MSFEAIYRGHCENCGNYFEPGEWITHPSRAEGWVHAQCPDDPNLTVATEPICPRCTARHVGEC
jgi:uncharacterized OB-fold protein